jgi:hypothetical protein
LVSFRPPLVGKSPTVQISPPECRGWGGRPSLG